MSERLVVDNGVVEAESASEVSAAAMGAAACVSCVGCPLMQQCVLPQAIEARARAAAGEAEPHESATEMPVEIDYAAALLDDSGPAVVWAQAAVAAETGVAVSENMPPADGRDKVEKKEVAASLSPSWALTFSELWGVSAMAPEPEPALESGPVFESELASEPNPASEPDPVPPPDSAPPVEPVLVSEPADIIGVAPVATHQEVRVAVEPAEVAVAPVIPTTPVAELHAESVAEASAEPAAKTPAARNAHAIEPYPVITETTAQVTIHDDSAMLRLETVDDAAATPWLEVAYEDPAMSQPEEIDEVESTVRAATAVIAGEVADYAAELAPPMVQKVVHEAPDALETHTPKTVVDMPPAAPVYHELTETDRMPIADTPHHEEMMSAVAAMPDVETVSMPAMTPLADMPAPPEVAASYKEEYPIMTESERQPLSVSLAEAPMQTEHMLAGVDDNGLPSEEIAVSLPEVSLSVAGDEETGRDEVLLSPVDMEMEETDNRAGSEPSQELLTNVVYNTIKRDDDAVLTGRDSDHAESEAPNAGYGSSWLAALLGVVAVFTVVRRRSGAVY